MHSCLLLLASPLSPLRFAYSSPVRVFDSPSLSRSTLVALQFAHTSTLFSPSSSSTSLCSHDQAERRWRVHGSARHEQGAGRKECKHSTARGYENETSKQVGVCKGFVSEEPNRRSRSIFSRCASIVFCCSICVVCPRRVDSRGGHGTLNEPQAARPAPRQQLQQRGPTKDWSASSNRINMGAPVMMKVRSDTFASRIS